MRSLPRAAWLYLGYAALLTFGLAINALFFNLYLVELGYAERGLGLAIPLIGDLTLLGLANSLPVLAAAASSLPIWWLVGRVGPRPGLLAAAVIFSASLLAVALWPAPLPLLLGAALSGPASVLMQVSAAPYMMRNSPAAARDSLFALNAGINIGVAGLGSLVGGLLPGLALAAIGPGAAGAPAYRLTIGVAAGLVLLAALPLALAGGEPARPAAERPGSAAGQLSPLGLLRLIAARPWATLRFMVAPLLISLGAALLIPYLNLYFRQRFGASDAALGLIFALIGVATGGATLAAPLLSGRLGKMGSVVLTQLLAVPCLLLLGAAPLLWLAVLVALARGALMNMASPLFDAYAMERTPEPARPAVIGLINGAFAAGYIIGPSVSAEVQLRYGFGPLFVATAVCYALAVLANWLIFLRRGGAEPAP